MIKQWQRLPLRVRLVALGAAGLLIGFAIGGVALVVALKMNLQHTVDETAVKTAEYTADLIDANDLPDPVPTSRDAIVVQVFDRHGNYEAGSTNANPDLPMLHGDQLAKALEGDCFTIDGAKVGVSGSVRVTATLANNHIVVVAVSQSQLGAVPKFVVGLTITFGALALVVTILLGWMVDRTLRPVDMARVKQREFVADAAHELRSPLANMRTELEVAARIGPQEGLVEDLLADVNRLSRMTEELLQLARMDNTYRSPPRTQIDLCDLINEVINDYHDVRVTLVSTVTESLIVQANMDGMQRILTNLLDNAVRHAETSVVISCEPVREGICLQVTDDGPGIPVADRERVFERFTRLDDARARDSGGSGLGLSIVSELVAAHHGTVTLHSAQPHGLTVEIRLPR